MLDEKRPLPRADLDLERPVGAIEPDARIESAGLRWRKLRLVEAEAFGDELPTA